ncbi:MAG: DUF6311 domain-containing protein [Spirochaetes bacterium]|nr:DUF6311 domain-containing protein [Spirochaetota bacterium]
MKFVELLERKAVKYTLLALSALGFLVSIASMQAQVIDFFINIIETRILGRELADPGRWIEYIFGTMYGFSVFFVIIWYFFIKKNFALSSCLLSAALAAYIYAYYSLFAANFEAMERLRFPLFALGFVIVFHIYSWRHRSDYLQAVFKKAGSNLAENKIASSSAFVFSCGGLLGALFFIHIFGTAVLDFTYTDWLMVTVDLTHDYPGMMGRDLSQHYLGWRFLRNSAWHFPLGLMDNIAHPFRISVIYTDSIPLFSVFFKILSPVLPESFQFFGLFGILSYILQGGLGALIIKKIGGNTPQSIAGSMFFTLSTTMIWRMYEHTSLAAHFIILLCMLVALQHEHYSFAKRVRAWSLLFFLSVGIHLYFVPTVTIFMFVCLLREYNFSKKLKEQCLVAGISFVILFVTMFSFGAFYFVRGMTIGDSDLGIASANLNAFFNPFGMSRFIQDMPTAAGFQFEGNSYLGLGLILFIVVIIGHTIKTGNGSRPCGGAQSHGAKKTYILGLAVLFLLFSLSPVITFNQYHLFTYPLPPPIGRIWSIFRSTGRYTWPIIYIAITACVWWAVTRFSAKKSLLILSIFLFFQLADLHSPFAGIGNRFRTRVTWQTELPSSAWAYLALEHDHIFFMRDYLRINSFLDLAANHGITVNDAYFARENTYLISANKEREAEHLLNNGPRAGLLYVFMDLEHAYLFRETGLNFFRIDNVVIGTSAERQWLDAYALAW